MERDAIRQEIQQHEARKNFWGRIHRDFPVSRNHQELGESLLAKYADEIGPMAIDEGIQFLGEKIEAEVRRRNRKDVRDREAAVYGGGGDGSGPAHGMQVDSRTGDSYMPGSVGYREDDAPASLGDAIRNRREKRYNAQRRVGSRDRREHGRF